MPLRPAVLAALVAAAGLAAPGFGLASDRPVGDLAAECDAGSARSCLAAALRYRHGKDAPRDPRAALRYFEKACDGGLAFGCGYAGEMLYSGLGVARAAEDGVHLMRRACADGDGWSCAQLRRLGVPAREDAAEGG